MNFIGNVLLLRGDPITYQFNSFIVITLCIALVFSAFRSLLVCP